jgi:hypothetical protein
MTRRKKCSRNSNNFRLQTPNTPKMTERLKITRSPNKTCCWNTIPSCIPWAKESFYRTRRRITIPFLQFILRFVTKTAKKAHKTANISNFARGPQERLLGGWISAAEPEDQRTMVAWGRRSELPESPHTTGRQKTGEGRQRAHLRDLLGLCLRVFAVLWDVQLGPRWGHLLQFPEFPNLEIFLLCNYQRRAVIRVSKDPSGPGFRRV